MNSNSTMVRQDKRYIILLQICTTAQLLVHVIIIIVLRPFSPKRSRKRGNGCFFITHEIKCPFMVVKCYPICSTAMPNVPPRATLKRAAAGYLAQQITHAQFPMLPVV